MQMSCSQMFGMRMMWEELEGGARGLGGLGCGQVGLWNPPSNVQSPEARGPAGRGEGLSCPRLGPSLVLTTPPPSSANSGFAMLLGSCMPGRKGQGGPCRIGLDRYGGCTLQDGRPWLLRGAWEQLLPTRCPRSQLPPVGHPSSCRSCPDESGSSHRSGGERAVAGSSLLFWSSEQWPPFSSQNPDGAEVGGLGGICPAVAQRPMTGPANSRGEAGLELIHAAETVILRGSTFHHAPLCLCCGAAEQQGTLRDAQPLAQAHTAGLLLCWGSGGPAQGRREAPGCCQAGKWGAACSTRDGVLCGGRCVYLGLLVSGCWQVLPVASLAGPGQQLGHCLAGGY